MIKKPQPYPILYLHHTGHFSGAENSLLHLANHLDHEKFTPIFLCPGEGEFPTRLFEKAIQVIPHKFGRLREIVKLLKSIRKILQVCHSHGITLLHSNGPQTNIPASLAGQWLRVPVIWHARNLIKVRMADIDRIAGFLPQKIICNSEAIRSRFMGGLTEKIAVTMINGVDLEDYDPSISGKMIRKDFGIPSKARVVGMTSRLGWDKGHLTLLEAAARLKDHFPDLWVFIVGGNVFEEDTWISNFLNKKAQELGISDRVIFAGYRRDVLRLYAAMDVFVLGTDAEPCGRVIFEAMAMAKPVVGTNNGGTPEIVVDGETGLLYGYGDAQGLADKIACLFNAPTLIRKMGHAGRKRIEEKFTIDKYVKKTQREYLRLIEGKTC